MRPASTVVLPLPGPAKTLSGPSPAVTTSRWLGEKSLRSTPRSERWQFLGPTSISCQFLPAQQVPAVDQVQQFVRRALANDADDEAVLMLAVVVAREEFNRIGRIAQNGKDTLDGGVGKHVIGRHLARDARRRMAPRSGQVVGLGSDARGVAGPVPGRAAQVLAWRTQVLLDIAAGRRSANRMCSFETMTAFLSLIG
jgi:hypothetical protein